jgi:DNA polymerase-3 subunit gamma/tau
MKRQATLYRRWRPRAFSGIVGQEPVVSTLRRAIETGRVAHAYLFSGPRGTGKTSTAKVLAMGLNCVNGPTPEPDGTCVSCRAIINNSSLDVVEMDAASNRGIDEIRDLRDRVNLAPVAGRMKVYIIDEVHMLTTEAFNALLKMLEEPPEHVVFVLATTEKHKVLPTIISRCQSFDFRRPGVETLVKKLAEIAPAEGIEVSPEALRVIAREGRGSFRDAEGLLDQLSSFSEGEITAAAVRELLGSVGHEDLLETTAALHERRAADSLRIVDRLSNEGKDLGQFVGELISHLRNLMLLPHAPEVALAEVGADERGPLEEQASKIPTAEVVRFVEAFGGTLGRMKRGGDPKLELELTFLKLARDYTEPSLDVLLSRLETLEAASGSVAANEREASPDVTRRDEPLAEEAVARKEDPPDGSETEARAGSDSKDVDWDLIIRELEERRPAVAAVYGVARAESFDGEVLKIAFPEELAIYVKPAADPKRLNSLQEILEEHLGVRPRLEFRVAGARTAEEVFGDGSSVASEGEPPPQVIPHTEPAPGPENAREVRNAVESEAHRVENGSGRAEDEGIIRDQRQVFEMARERFGLSGQDRGS